MLITFSLNNKTSLLYFKIVKNLTHCKKDDGKKQSELPRNTKWKKELLFNKILIYVACLLFKTTIASKKNWEKGWDSPSFTITVFTANKHEGMPSHSPGKPLHLTPLEHVSPPPPYRVLFIYTYYVKKVTTITFFKFLLLLTKKQSYHLADYCK